MKTQLSNNSILNHLGNLRGISTRNVFLKDKHKRNVSLRRIHRIRSFPCKTNKRAEHLCVFFEALVAGQHISRQSLWKRKENDFNIFNSRNKMDLYFKKHVTIAFISSKQENALL